jgi:hypothetical protein
VVRGRPEQRFPKSKGQSRSKSKFKRKCFICQSEKHLKRDCPERKNVKGDPSSSKNQSGYQSDVFTEGGYHSLDVLMVSKEEMTEGWITDSGCSYYMTPNKAYFKYLKIEDLGIVKLGENRPCNIHWCLLITKYNGL